MNFMKILDFQPTNPKLVISTHKIQLKIVKSLLLFIAIWSVPIFSFADTLVMAGLFFVDSMFLSFFHIFKTVLRPFT